MAQTLRTQLKTVASTFPNYKFSFCRKTYGRDAIIKIKPVNKAETFAYYGGDDCGYIVDNSSYYSIANKFQSEFAKQNIRVNEFIENSKTMLLEFKQL
jgi:hypothetical protein